MVVVVGVRVVVEREVVVVVVEVVVARTVVVGVVVGTGGVLVEQGETELSEVINQVEKGQAGKVGRL